MNIVQIEDQARAADNFRKATEILLKTTITDEFFEEVVIQQRVMEENHKTDRIKALVELCDKRGVPVPEDVREYATAES